METKISSASREDDLEMQNPSHQEILVTSDISHHNMHGWSVVQGKPPKSAKRLNHFGPWQASLSPANLAGSMPRMTLNKVSFLLAVLTVQCCYSLATISEQNPRWTLKEAKMIRSVVTLVANLSIIDNQGSRQVKMRVIPKHLSLCSTVPNLVLN